MTDLTEAVRPAGTDFIFRIPNPSRGGGLDAQPPRLHVLHGVGRQLGAAHGIGEPR